MLERRSLLASAGLLTAAAGVPALAQAQAPAWRARFPELVFAIIPAENASGVVNRWTPFTDYLTRVLGTKVTLRVANDYAAVMEGQRSGTVHFASYGPASFARARVTGVKTDAFGIEVNSDGTKGYYSVFYVRANSPYQKIEDLKGKAVGLVDPNSTSGYNMPLYALDKMGIKPNEFFSNMVVTGSHENAVLALAQGTVDVAANFWNAENDSNLTRMAAKGLAKQEDFRIIYKSDLIPNSPFAYLASLPADLKAAITKAFMESPTKAKAAFDKLSDGKDREFKVVDAQYYEPVVELIKFIDQLRKQKS